MRKQTYTSHVSIDIWMCVPVLDTWSQAACHVQHDPGGPVRTCSTVKQTPVLTNSLYWLVKNGIFITHNGILLESPNCSLKTLHNQGLDHCCCCLFSKALWVDWILKKAARAPLLGESPKNESSDHLWKGVYFKIQKNIMKIHLAQNVGNLFWYWKFHHVFFLGGGTFGPPIIVQSRILEVEHPVLYRLFTRPEHRQITWRENRRYARQIRCFVSWKYTCTYTV